jgi:hypothetical protein
VVKKSSWNGCFFRPPAPLFVRKNGPTFVARNWPQMCDHFPGLRRNPRVHGDEAWCLCPETGPTLWGHF